MLLRVGTLYLLPYDLLVDGSLLPAFEMLSSGLLGQMFSPCTCRVLERWFSACRSQGSSSCSTESLLEIQILRLHPLSESETLEVGPNPLLKGPLRDSHSHSHSSVTTTAAELQIRIGSSINSLMFFFSGERISSFHQVLKKKKKNL